MASETKVKSGANKRPTRSERKELGRQIWSDRSSLDVVHRDVAGIDSGSREHYVAVGPDRDEQPVRTFGCFTADLQRVAEWLKRCRIKTVVMQSTGVYWIPMYDVLEQHGFDVWLVNARDTRNLPGRKSDVQESQWLLKLHTYGLLRKSFRPAPEIRALRTCWRERAEYVQQAGACIQRMQKALTEMNIQLATVLSDLSGVTGMRIVRSIVGGERDGMVLAEFRDPNVKASKETIARSLEGTWLPEQLAVLRRQLADWDHMQRQMAACDVDLEALMKKMPAAEAAPVKPVAPAPKQSGKRKRQKKTSRNEPNFELGDELKRVTGVDLTRIDGIKVMTVQTLITEAGPDMSKWATEDHFVSWIGLASRLATALRIAASTLRESDSYPGAQFRRLRARLGSPKAITAMGAKQARLVYRMLKFGEEYVDKGTVHYEERYREQKLRLLAKQAARQGFALTPLTNPA
jgi:transposase